MVACAKSEQGVFGLIAECLVFAPDTTASNHKHANLEERDLFTLIPD
jgi:hypothetical protein